MGSIAEPTRRADGREWLARERLFLVSELEDRIILSVGDYCTKGRLHCN